MAVNKFCTRTNIILGLIGFLAVLASFLFSNLLKEILVESLGQENPVIPEECIETVITTAVTLNCLSLVTFPFLMIGIHRLKTWMVLPWTVVTGIQTLAGGILLWYLVFQTGSASLVQCLSLYTLVAYGFIGISFIYFKLKRVDEAKKKIMMNQDKVRILVF